jgi:CSLREA domain-containing protein
MKRSPRLNILGLLIAVIVLLIVTIPMGAIAKTFTVNSTLDAVDANPGDGVALTAGGVTTLRAAIQEANALAGRDTIILPAGTYLLTIAGAGEQLSATGDLDIRSNLSIIGAGANVTIVDAGGIDRVFDFPVACTVDISDITIRGGNVTGTGGGLNTGVSVTLTSVEITNCKASSDGGGIYNVGTLTILNSAIVNDTSGTAGGGISDQSSGTLNATNVTFSGNYAAGNGGALASDAASALTNCTVANNSSAGTGGIVRTHGGVNLLNTIVANNTGSINNLQNGINSLGYNLDSENSAGWSNMATGDLRSTNPLLGALQNNGGSTRTQAIPTNSPAKNAGNPTGSPSTDQRGFPRDASPDIGAYEYGAALPIQLATFTASLVSVNSVHLAWTTVTETNNYGFYVQRRASSEQSFVELLNSFVAGHGTTLQPQQYSFSDRDVAAGQWSYRLKQIDLDGTVHYTDPVQVEVLTDVNEGNRPTTFALEQNYPNPFNPSTVISYEVAGVRDQGSGASNVKLAVYDMLGWEVAVLVNERQAPGSHSVRFNASGLASGVYFYRLVAGEFVQTKALMLLK